MGGLRHRDQVGNPVGEPAALGRFAVKLEPPFVDRLGDLGRAGIGGVNPLEAGRQRARRLPVAAAGVPDQPGGGAGCSQKIEQRVRVQRPCSGVLSRVAGKMILEYQRLRPSMNRSRHRLRQFGALILAALLSAQGSGATAGHKPAVVIDGEFADWTAATPLAAPPPEAGTLLGAAWALADDAAVYLSIELRDPRNVQSMPATLGLVLTGEDAPGVGSYHGMSAARVFEFSPPGADGFRFGARMLSALDRGWHAEPLAGSGVLSAPTHSATRFEFRIPRSAIPASATGLAIVYYDDKTGTRSPAVPLADIAAAPVRRASPAALLERPPTSALRALVWNVGGEGFERHLEALAAAAARWDLDLLMLDEAPPGVGARLGSSLPPGWHVAAGASGGRQRGILAARHRLRPVREFAHLAYPPEALRMVANEGTRFMRRDLKRARREGVAAAGAVLEFGGRDWLLVAVDLHCCGRDGSVEDRMRIYQARVIRAALERAREAHPDLAGVLLGGDLNLVGSRTPLDVLVGAGGAEAGTLTPVRALQLDGLSNHTWGPPGDRFPPGRLDFVLHSPGLEPVNALVLDAHDLGAEAAPDAELLAASDHHPLIVDFRIAADTPRSGSTRSGDR